MFFINKSYFFQKINVSCYFNVFKFLQKNKEKRYSNINSVPVNSKKFNLDQIDASIKSIRTAIAQTRITQEKLRMKNHEKEYFNLKDQGIIESLINYYVNYLTKNLKRVDCYILTVSHHFFYKH